jgi:hypothetical protein
LTTTPRPRHSLTHALTAARLLCSSLCSQADFLEAKTLLEEAIVARGHICRLLPKYHCELAECEWLWVIIKRHLRKHSTGSIVALRKQLPEAIALVTQDNVQSFFRIVDRYEAAYRDGVAAGEEVEQRIAALRGQRRSHRRVSAAQLELDESAMADDEGAAADDEGEMADD